MWKINVDFFFKVLSPRSNTPRTKYYTIEKNLMHLKMRSCNVKNDAIRTISESHMMIEVIVVYINIYVSCFVQSYV